MGQWVTHWSLWFRFFFLFFFSFFSLSLLHMKYFYTFPHIELHVKICFQICPWHGLRTEAWCLLYVPFQTKELLWFLHSHLPVIKHPHSVIAVALCATVQLLLSTLFMKVAFSGKVGATITLPILNQFLKGEIFNKILPRSSAALMRSMCLFKLKPTFRSCPKDKIGIQAET